MRTVRRYTARFSTVDRVSVPVGWFLVAGLMIYSVVRLGSWWSQWSGFQQSVSGLPGMYWMPVGPEIDGSPAALLTISEARNLLLAITVVLLAINVTFLWFMWRVQQFSTSLKTEGWTIDDECIVLPQLWKSRPKVIGIDEITEVTIGELLWSCFARPPLIVADGRRTPIDSHLEEQDALLADIVELAGLVKQPEGKMVRYKRLER